MGFFPNKPCYINNLPIILMYKKSQKFYLLISNNLFNTRVIIKIFNNKKDFSCFKLLK